MGRALALAALLALWGCNTQERDLAVGQVWSYDNRPGEGASTLQILHVERGTPLGDVYFVSVHALKVKRIKRQTVQFSEVSPLVFTHDALKRSLTAYRWSQKVDRPHLKQLDLWLREAREGRASDRTFSIPLKDALDLLESDQADAEKRLFEGVS